MRKQELRLQTSLRRTEITPESIEADSIAIANNLLELPVWSLDYFHIFLQIPEKKEVNTSHILSILQGRDKQVVIPKIGASNTLINYLLTDGTRIVKNPWNIPEPVDGIEVPPEKIDVTFVPLLAFDDAGHRVGYGKGYYDHFLALCRPDMIKIGLSFFENAEKITDVHEADVRLDYCITPRKIYEFS
jgi:5-formyltetrahydrofolate cyclo-ligase